MQLSVCLCVERCIGFPTGQHGYVGLCDDAEQRDATHERTSARRCAEIRRLESTDRSVCVADGVCYHTVWVM